MRPLLLLVTSFFSAFMQQPTARYKYGFWTVIFILIKMLRDPINFRPKRFKYGFFPSFDRKIDEIDFTAIIHRTFLRKCFCTLSCSLDIFLCCNSHNGNYFTWLISLKWRMRYCYGDSTTKSFRSNCIPLFSWKIFDASKTVSALYLLIVSPHLFQWSGQKGLQDGISTHFGIQPTNNSIGWCTYSKRHAVDLNNRMYFPGLTYCPCLVDT